MNYRNYIIGTVVVLLSVVLVVAAYDIAVLKDGGPRATISRIILHAVYTPPYGAIIAVGLGLFNGVLLGHLFWPQKSP